MAQYAVLIAETAARSAIPGKPPCFPGMAESERPAR